MSSKILFFFFIPFLSIILLLVNLTLATHNPYGEKKSPFECGFSSFLFQNRTQFNISFFIFALLFLIFDIELLIIYPYSLSIYSNKGYGLSIMLIFFIILTIGFIFELGKNALTISSKQYNNKNEVIYTADLQTLLFVIEEVSNNLNILSYFTNEYHQLVTQYDIRVFVEQDSMSIDVPSSMSDEVANHVTERLRIIDTTINITDKLIEDGLHRAFGLEEDVLRQDPRYAESKVLRLLREHELSRQRYLYFTEIIRHHS